MQFLRKLFGKQRGRERLMIELPVLVGTGGGDENRYKTAEKDRKLRFASEWYLGWFLRDPLIDCRGHRRTRFDK